MPADRGERCDFCGYSWVLAYVVDDVALAQACLWHRDQLVRFADSGLGTYVGRSVGA